MKKATAIFLLVVTLYNLGGYLLMFQFLIFRSDVVAEQQIGKNMYNAAALVEIKIPVHLPGIDSWRGYENVSGTVQLAQGAYNYVRMKMTTDTIYVMCVPNYKTTRLLKGNMICAREVSDAPFNSKKQSTPVKSVSMISVPVSERPAIKFPPLEMATRYNQLLRSEAVTCTIGKVKEPPRSLMC